MINPDLPGEWKGQRAFCIVDTLTGELYMPGSDSWKSPGSEVLDMPGPFFKTLEECTAAHKKVIMQRIFAEIKEAVQEAEEPK